jgi:putative peptidoglycan lipid II flippase
MTSNRTVTKAAGLMMVAIMLSRFLGLFREMLIARQFGQGGLVSAYTNAFNLPDLLYFFLSSGALSSAFIPVFTERFHTGRQKEAWQIFSIIGCVMGLVLTGAILVFEVWTRPLVLALAVPGFADKPELVNETVALTRIILPCQLFFFLGGLMMGTLESRQRFSARAAGPVIYNIGIIAGALILTHWLGIRGLAWGALIGAFSGNIGYTYYCLRREGYEFRPSLNLRHPGVVKVGKLALPVILGLSLPQIDVIINKWFATYVSAAAPAALNYANRLMQVPLGIFAQAAGTAILPTLSAYAARNAIDDLRSGVSFGLRAIMALNIPATLFMIVMADPMVRTIYMNGQFTSADVGTTSIALVFYSAGIFAWAGQAIVARGFFAMQDTGTPILLGSIATVIFIPLNYVLMQVMGHGGLALSTSIAATLHLLALTICLRSRLHGIEGARVLRSIGKACVASAVMVVVCLGLRSVMGQVVDIETRKGAALLIIGSVAIAGVSYIAALKALRTEEADFVWDVVKRRFSRSNSRESDKSESDSVNAAY